MLHHFYYKTLKVRFRGFPESKMKGEELYEYEPYDEEPRVGIYYRSGRWC